MSAPEKNVIQSRGNLVDDLTNMSNCLQPPPVPGLALFIEQAATALGGNEASLGRMMGVSRATVSSWKRRGLPERYENWFRVALPEKIVVQRSHGEQPVSVEARKAFLAYMKMTEGRLFDSPIRSPLPVTPAAERMYGVLALAEFVYQRMEAKQGDVSSQEVAEVLATVLTTLRGSDASCFY